MTPIVSVVMPVYNVARYLRESAESVLGQTLKDIELVLVDDGSTDGSSAICDECAAADPRVKIVHQRNGGLSRARNAGLQVASAPLVMFCDSDDALLPDACRLMVEKMRASGADLVRCGVDVVRKTATTCLSVDSAAFNVRYGEDADPACADAWQDVDAVAWNKLYRRAVLGRFGIDFCAGIVHEDFGFTLKYCLVAGRMAFVEKKLYRYFLRDSGIMGSKACSLDGAMGYLAALEDAFAFMVRQNLVKTRLMMFLCAYARGFQTAVEDCPPDGHEALYAAAGKFLRGLNLSEASGHVASVIRDIVDGRRMTRRYGIGPLALVKVTNRLDKAAVRILGIRIWRRCYT